MSRKKFPDKLKAMRDAILPECVGEMDSLTAGIREVSLYLLKTLFHDNGDPRYRADREDPADGADEAKQKEGLQFTLEIENPRSLEAPHDSLTSLLDDLHPFINEAVPNPTARQGAVVHGGSIGPQVVPATAPTVDATPEFIDRKMAELSDKYAVRELPFARDDPAPGYSSWTQGFLRKIVRHDGSVYKIVPTSNDFAKNSIFHEVSIYEILQRERSEAEGNHVMVYDSILFMDSAFIYKMKVCKPVLGQRTITILDLSTALATAVGFLHERRITHLDIKLGNVLVADGDVILLADYDQSVPFTVSGEDVPRLIFGGGTLGHRWSYQTRTDWRRLGQNDAFLLAREIDATSMCVTVLDAWISNALSVGQLRFTTVRSIGAYPVATIDGWIGSVETGLASLTNKEAAIALLRMLRDLDGTRSSPPVVEATLQALRTPPPAWGMAPSAPATPRWVGFPA
jgi:hypothetical protein